ncbi:hypothetical protein [Nocardioides yefusunii]|uniref:Uncharacterized protein n=1 Tax=Nocardioides yefusunii TaxID=2500546 RepID=A0ABW1QV02_9ACTN|nr:hypothetical protein [Nocardioides yefusunii]
MSRRGVVRSSLWAAPAVTVAAAAPAYAASTQPIVTCTPASWESALYAKVSFTGLNGSNEWRSGWSSATLAIRIGRAVGDTTDATNDPALGFQSAGSGLTVSVASYSFHVTLPYVVTWTSTPRGWTVERVSGTTYRFVPAASIVTSTVVPHSSSPGTTGPGVAIPASGLFKATIPASNFGSGERVKAKSYTFSPSYRATYTTSGARCAPRSGTSAWDTTLTVKPT